MQKPRIAFFAVGRIHFDSELASKLASDMFARLKSKKFNFSGSERVLWNVEEVKNALENIQVDEVDLILIFQTTFTDSTMVLEITKRITAPTIIWSVPEEWDGGRLRLNSFTGMNLIAHALHKNQKKYFYIFSKANNQRFFKYIETLAAAAHSVKNLRTQKMGLLGDHPEGFETSEFSSEQIQTFFGVGIHKYKIEDFFERVNLIDHSRITSTKTELEQKLSNLKEMDQPAVERTIAVSEAIQDLQKEDDLSGLAVRCWPEFFTELKCAACGALSLASEKGIPCSCEADIVGLLTQYILQNLSGHPSIGVDIVGFDLEDNTSAVWHCGLAPFSMANPNYPIEAANHSNRGIPLLMQFPLKPGKVTIARLSQSDDQMKLIISQGEMLDRPRPFTGTCGVLRFKNHASQILEKIMSIGMEHHISFTYGDYFSELEVIAKILDLPIIYL